MIVHRMAQGTPEWFQARLGRLTGSRAKDMLATIKTGEAAARRDYRVELVCERLTGQAADDGFVSADMRRGSELEAAARSAYEAQTGLIVMESGFCSHDTLLAGASVDGDVGGFEGIVEIKCPRSANHLRYLRSGGLPPEHAAQVTHNLWITGAQWCDVVSYDPRFPEGLQAWVCRVLASDLDLVTYEAKARAFLAEVDDECAEVRGRMAA